MCRYFKKNTCANSKCTFAHEGHDFDKLVPFTRLKKGKPSASPKKLRDAQKQAESEKNADNKRKRGKEETDYEDMFQDLVKKRNKGEDGEDDGIARI